MKSATAIAILRAELASTDQGAPAWIELFPAGPRIDARDGRTFYANTAAVLAAFQANRGPLPIDYEHGQDLLAARGEAAPAAGWIVAVEDRGGAVWGQVEWTDRAAQMIAAREYRFLSPAFNHTKDFKITRLLGAALVNRPALELTALSREQPNQENETMKAIAKALGLADGASEDAIVASLNASGEERKAICRALRIDEASDAAALTAAIAELATAKGKADADATALAVLQTQLKDAQTALAGLQTKDADREIAIALDKAAAEGKITPASREGYLAMCKVEGGLERFRALAATLPVICEPSKIGDQPATDAGDDVDPVALAARARKYQDEQAAAGRTISISEAVSIVRDQK
jgi:phage I-like protein